MSAVAEAVSSTASDLSRLFDLESEPLTPAEAEAIVADFVARAATGAEAPTTNIGSRACRCERPWEFERRRCSKCGKGLA